MLTRIARYSKHMTKILKLLGFNTGSKQIALDRHERKELASLSSVRFVKLDEKQRDRFLQLGAKDFSRKFAGVIKDLASE